MRRISVCLLFLFTLLVLVGCHQKPSLPASTAHVFRATTIEIPDADYGVLLDEGATWDGERFTIGTYLLDRDTGGYWLDFSKTYTFLPDGTGVTEGLPTSHVESVQTDALPDKMVDLPNGDTLSTEVVTVGETLQYYVSVRDATGDVVFSTDLAEVFRFDYTQVKEGNKTFTLLDAVVSDGKYLTLTTGGLCAFDDTGTLLWVEDTKKNPTALCSTDVGILYLYGDTYEQSLRFLDPATGEFGETLTLPEELFGAGGKNATFILGAGYDLYVKTNLALWGLNLTTGSDGTVSCLPEKIIDWVNSDLSAAELEAFSIADSHTMTAVWHDSFGEEDNKLLLLTYVAPEDVILKEEIQLALLTDDFTLQRAIADFNRNSETCRIVTTDYTIYAEDIRKTRFDADISAGSVPDIVLLTDTNGMVDSYIRAELFADLTPWLQFTYGDELLGNITKPYQNQTGQQFVLPTTPLSGTYWGKEDYFDSVPTVEEILAILKDPPAGTCLLGSERSDFWYLADGLFLNMVDLANGTCSFDSDTFVDACKRLITMESTEERTETPLLCFGRIASVYSYVTWLMQGEYTVPVGLPSDDEKLYLTDSSYSFLAVTANSTHKEDCYAFLAQYMRINHTITENCFTRQDVYESIKYYAGKTIFMTPSGFRTVPNDWLDDPAKMTGITGNSFQITKADADAYIAFLDLFDGRMEKSTGLYDIYHEEIMDNGRTAKEIATAIQSRASIYLAENS